jgi:hypothetical protein
MARATKKILSVKERIIAIHQEMRELVIESGVQEPKYNFMLKKLDNQSDDYYQILLDWLIHFKDNEYTAARIMWNKMSPHGWRNLKSLVGVNDLPEQRILASKFRAVRIAWFNRPRPPKKQIKVEDNESRS